MIDIEETSPGSTADEAVEDEATDPSSTKRQRGTINFPYADLDDAVKVAKAVFSKGGQSASLDQVAAALDHKNIRSGGFRSKVNSARLFGLLKASGMTVRLEPLGLQAVDSASEKAARADAFLRVPLFKAIFEKYRGNLLPPTDALEAEMVSLGVAPNQKDRARQVFLRSAEQAGYFQSGKDRLIPPAIARTDKLNAPEPPKNDPNGSEKKSLRDHPLIQGLFEMLPERGPWPDDDVDEWLTAAKMNFKLVYGKKGQAEANQPPDAPTEPPRPAERFASDPTRSSDLPD